MPTHNQPTAEAFRQRIDAYVKARKYIGIQYYTDLHELIKTSAIIKEVFEKEEVDYLRLHTGEEIRLDQVSRLDGQAAPGHDAEDFSCSL